jgi:hypothetical protein
MGGSEIRRSETSIPGPEVSRFGPENRGHLGRREITVTSYGGKTSGVQSSDFTIAFLPTGYISSRVVNAKIIASVDI